MANQRSQLRGRVIRGTRNVFADLGFPDASERQAKLRLAYVLNQVLQTRKVAHANAAKVLGVTQRKLTALREYKLAESTRSLRVNANRGSRGAAPQLQVPLVARPRNHHYRPPQRWIGHQRLSASRQSHAPQQIVKPRVVAQRIQLRLHP